MASEVWLDDKATIVVLPSGQQGIDLLALAESWVEIGLLAPAFWIQPENVKIAKDAPPAILTSVIGTLDDKSLARIDVDLFEQLARDNLKTIRLVKVRSATPKRHIDELQDQIVAGIEDYLNVAMPARDKRLNDMNVASPLEVITLLCPSTEFNAMDTLSRELRGHGVVFVAATEDRSSPWSTDAFVRDGKRFDGFMMMHIATAGGLWNGLPISSQELGKGENITSQGVWVTRVFLSGVLTDSLSRRVAAEVLQDAGDASVIADYAPAGTSFIEDVNQDQYVDMLIEHLMGLEDAVLTYRRVSDREASSKANWGFWRSVGDYFAFSWQKYLRIPHWAWRYVRNSASRRLERKLYGPDGDVTVNAELNEENLDIRDRELLGSFETVTRTAEEAQVAMRAPVRLAQVRSTPELWSKIRSMLFASLDGGHDSLEETYRFPKLEKTIRPIFRSVTALFSDPDEAWSFPEGTAVPDGIPRSFSWSTLEDAFSASETLESWLHEAESSLDEASRALVNGDGIRQAKRDELKSLSEKLRTAGALIRDEHGVEKAITLAQAAKLQTIYQTGDHIPEPVVVDETPASDEWAPPADQVDESADAPDIQVNRPASSSEDDSISVPPGSHLDDLSFDIVAGLRVRKTLEAELKAQVKENASLEAEVTRLTSALETRKSVIQSFTDWIHASERSLIWRVRKLMQAERTKVSEAYAQLQVDISALTPTTPGELIKLRRSFHKSLMVAWPLILGIGVLVGLIIILPKSAFNFLPYLLIADIVAVIIMYLSASVVYYRGWSIFERQVKNEITRLENVRVDFINAREEEARLEVIHRQTTEWLELLARTLHHPWHVRPSWLVSGLQALDTSALPFAMRVAQANDNDQASRSILRDRALRSLLTPGWREDAFSALVENVGQLAGRGGDTMSLDALDRDLPHATNGARELLKKHLDNTLALEAVARARLSPIIMDLQTNAMAVARPSVVHVDDNPLTQLNNDIQGIDLQVTATPWAEFLEHSLTRGDGGPDPVTPLSVLSINPAQVVDGAHENVRSFALMPEHVQKRLNSNKLNGLKTEIYDGAFVRPLDAVLRVDFVGPLGEDALRIWSNTPGKATKRTEMPNSTEEFESL